MADSSSSSPASPNLEPEPNVPERDRSETDPADAVPSPPDASAPDASSPDASDADASGADTPDAADPPPSTGSLRAAVLDAVQRNLPEPTGPDEPLDAPERTVGAYARWLPVLRTVPWVLAVVFGGSFLWDFPGITLTVFGRTLVVEGLLRITSVSGLIGFFTNWLAITMLFQPREPRPLLGQGVIPAQRERVAWRLAQAVSDELINEAIIMEKIHDSDLAARYRDLALSVAEDVSADPAVRREVKRILRDRLREVFSTEAVQRRIATFTAEQLERNAGGGLPGLALRTYRLFGEEDFQRRLHEAVRRLPDSVEPMLDELDPAFDRLPAELERRSDEIEALLTQIVLRFVETLDVQRIVLDNVRNYDERQLEDLLKRTTNEQLTYIKYLGGVLGVVGGFVIWDPVPALLTLAVVSGLVYVVEEALR